MARLWVMLFLLSIRMPAQMMAGGKLGISIADVVTNVSDANARPKVGGCLAGVFSYGLGNGKIAAVGEFVLVQKGGKNIVSGEVNRFYIEVPILLRYLISVKDSFPVKFFLNAGPYFGVGFGTRSGGEVLYNKDAGNPNLAELGLGIGGGAMYSLKSGFLFLEVRYQYALTNMVDYTLERNQNTLIAAGYLHVLKAKTTPEQKDKTVSPGFE